MPIQDLIDLGYELEMDQGWLAILCNIIVRERFGKYQTQFTCLILAALNLVYGIHK